MRKTIWIILISLLVGTMLIGAMSCTNKIAKAKDTFDNNKKEAAEYCAEKFPVKTEYIKGDSVLLLDTLYVGENVFDTVTVETKDTVYRTITKTLPAKVINKTIRITDTIVKENTARIEDFRIQLRNKDIENGILKADRDNWKSKAKQRFWWLLIAIGAMGAYTILKIKKIISF